jgi:hypothetical protein
MYDEIAPGGMAVAIKSLYPHFARDAESFTISSPRGETSMLVRSAIRMAF